MWEHCASWSEPMSMKEKKAAFERVNKPYESAVLTFHGVEGFDVYNCSPCIYAYGETDVAITGEGTIDGNGSNDT